MVGDFINNDGTIPSGLPIDIMRHCMENKELLATVGGHTLAPGETSIYIGTGAQDINGCAITTSTSLRDGYFTSLRDSGSSHIIDRGGVSDKNFKRYDYPSILTFISPGAVYAGEIQYSHDNCYINIEWTPYGPDGKTYNVILNEHIYDNTSLEREAENYTLYSFSSIHTHTVYYTDKYGANTEVFYYTEDIFHYLQYSAMEDPHTFPDLYTKVLSNYVYEFTVKNATTVNETEQFSTLKGMKGILAGADMTHKIIEKKLTSYFLLYVGIIRFSSLRFINITFATGAPGDFSPEKTYFVFNYRGGNIKILHTQEQFSDALESGGIIYEMPIKYNNDNLYFIASPDSFNPGTGEREDSDYTFLDVYSEYDFINFIQKNFDNPDQLTIGYFSSSFLDCSYTSLGYSCVTNGVRDLIFEGKEGTNEWRTTGGSYYKGYQRIYTVRGINSPTGSLATDINVFSFLDIFKEEESAYPREVPYEHRVSLKANSTQQPHYMIVYKLINKNPSS